MPCLWSSNSTPSACIPRSGRTRRGPSRAIAPCRARGRARCSTSRTAGARAPAGRKSPRLEVERRVAVEERAHAVQRQPRLGQRPGLGGAQPAAVGERGAASRRGCSRRSSRRSRCAPQVIGAAEPGDAAADDDDPAAHGGATGAGCDLELDQDAGHRELADDRRARRPRRREVLGLQPIPGREVGRVGEEALDTASRASEPRPPASSTASMSSQDALGLRLEAAGDDRSVAGSTAARPDRSSRSPNRTASAITASPRPWSIRARPRCDELVCSPVQPSTADWRDTMVSRTAAERSTPRARLHYPVRCRSPIPSSRCRRRRDGN